MFCGQIVRAFATRAEQQRERGFRFLILRATCESPGLVMIKALAIGFRQLRARAAASAHSDARPRRSRIFGIPTPVCHENVVRSLPGNSFRHFTLDSTELTFNISNCSSPQPHVVSFYE